MEKIKLEDVPDGTAVLVFGKVGGAPGVHFVTAVKLKGQPNWETVPPTGYCIYPEADVAWTLPDILNCNQCGKSFIGRDDANFCSNACRQKAYRRRRDEDLPQP
jgi:hypothetical protein